MKNSVDTLSLNRPPSRWETLAGVRLQNTEPVKEQLLQELIELESQLAHLKDANGRHDFSLVQTYRDMIHSRRVMFHQLNR
ncbi:MAG TPA: hypothetical protein VL027_13160 [Spongiibacteraceae bacterium]|nr:hypothetical protein [Spongiibacteraceae bacterium]